MKIEKYMRLTSERRPGDERYKLPEIPMFDIPEELKEYGVGACFMIVHEQKDNPDSPLKFIHAFTAISEM